MSLTMDLQQFLRSQFDQYVPPTPESVARSRYDVTLSWSAPGGAFTFLDPADLLYKVQKKEKIPPWRTVYSGGKTQKTVENLASGQAHVFRLRVIIKSTSAPHLAARAVRHYGSEQAVYDQFDRRLKDKPVGTLETDDNDEGSGEGKADETENRDVNKVDEKTNKLLATKQTEAADGSGGGIENRAWLESSWSENYWCSTEPQGASVVCFCMAVRCGYIKQLQQMLDERSELLEIVNSVNGLTPLITAINKGELNTIKFLLNAGAEVNRPAAAGHTPLQLALLAARMDVAGLLLERGADIGVRDRNGLRAEHYAVDSGQLGAVTWVLDRGGELEVEDNHGWTPLFRAVSQGASCELISELLRRGADVTTTDRAGLALPDVARLLRDRRGRPRDSVVRLVDPRYPHERALDHFTRLTKKIYSVQTVFK